MFLEVTSEGNAVLKANYYECSETGDQLDKFFFSKESRMQHTQEDVIF